MVHATKRSELRTGVLTFLLFSNPRCRTKLHTERFRLASRTDGMAKNYKQEYAFYQMYLLYYTWYEIVEIVVEVQNSVYFRTSLSWTQTTATTRISVEDNKRVGIVTLTLLYVALPGG